MIYYSIMEVVEMKKVCTRHSQTADVFFRGGGMKKSEEKKNRENKTIWKDRHTPLKERKTSSGITFWPERVR